MSKLFRRKEMQSMKNWKKRMALLMAAAMILTSYHIPAGAAGEGAPQGQEETQLALEDLDPSALHVKKLGETQDAEPAPEEEASFDLTDRVRVSIFLENSSARDAGYSMKNVAQNAAASSYREALRQQQDALTAQINRMLGHEIEVKWNLTLTVNAISAWVQYGDIIKIQTMDGVKKVALETQYEAPVVTENAADPETANAGENMVGAWAAWDLGYTGAGSRIAIIDTGIDTAHQSFNADAFNHAITEAGAGAELMTQISSNLANQLNSKSRNYVNAKIPYAYNYVDGNTTINHQSDTQGNHGSHVAGIAAANRYIKSGSSYADAAQQVNAVGMAPDAQLLIMKVFGASGGAYDSDYMAAIEDAIVLDCDAANLSLGSAAPGWTFDDTYQSVLNSLADPANNEGMVVSISAGNSYSFSSFTDSKNLYKDDVHFHAGGSPGSYVNSFGTAAAQNTITTGAPLIFNGSQKVFYTESTESSEGEAYNNPAMSTIAGTYSYVYIDAPGEPSDYAAVSSAESLSGKIVIVHRGDLSFSEKGNNAVSYRPKGMVIANNTDGVIRMDLSDFEGSFPMVSITLKNAEQIKAGGTKHTAGGLSYYTGTVQVSSVEETVITDRAEAEMTDFSAWGVPGSLLMKPEITAPGGDIYSVYGTAKTSSGGTEGGTSAYVSYSGTSMAAPHIAGLAAVVAEYLRENPVFESNPALSGSYSTRAIIQSLLMSTATPMAPDGEYLSVLQQGAGLADVSQAVSVPSVIMISDEGKTLTVRTGANADGKVKAELGDDPEKEGVYSFGFTVYNLTDRTLTYELRTDLFTQKISGEFLSRGTAMLPEGGVSYVWNGAEPAASNDHDVDKDGDTDEADAQAILDYLTGVREEADCDLAAADMDKDGAVTSYDAYLLLNWEPEGGTPAEGYSVAPHGTAEVTVLITLTNAQKNALAAYENGAYLEGFTYLSCKETTAEGESLVHEHSIPILGFYGSWTDPSMFDNTSYVDTVYGTDTKLPYTGNSVTNYMTVKYDGVTAKFQGNPYAVEEGGFPAERLAVNANNDFVSIFYNLIRSAGTTGFAVSRLDENHTVTDVLSSQVTGNSVVGAYYYVNQQSWQNTGTKLFSVNKNASSYGLSEGDRFRIGFYAVPEYNAMLVNDSYNAAGSGMLNAAGFTELLESSALGSGAFIGYDFTVDNTDPVISSVSLSGNTLTVSASDNLNLAYVAVLSLDGKVIYAESVPGQATCTLSLSASSAIANADGYVAVFAGDYAGNEAAKAVKVNNNASGSDPSAVTSIELAPSSLDLYKGNETDLVAKVLPLTADDRSVSWRSANTGVATVDEAGHVTAVGAGSTTITATAVGNSSVTASCTVKVTSISKTLYAAVWDEEGDVYFSSFNANNVAENAWTRQHSSPISEPIHSAMMKNSSTLYAGTLDTSAATTEIYTVNRSTYALTDYAPNYYYATDMALGASSSTYAAYAGMVYTVGSYVAGGPIEKTTYNGTSYVGLPYAMSIDDDENSLFDESVFLAGIAVKTRSSTGGTYYVLDENGVIWTTTLALNSAGNAFEFSTPSKVMETGISTSFLYQSLYYDGTYLYWSHYADNMTELIIINPSAKTVYRAGNFGEGVWPVAGLYVNGSVAPNAAEDEPEETAAEIPAALASLQPLAGRKEIMTDAVLARFRAEAEKMGGKAEESSSSASSSGRAEDALSGGKAGETGQETNVSYTAKEDGTTNGLFTVAYDPNELSYTGAEVGHYYSINVDEENGHIIYAFAQKDSELYEKDEEIASFSFTAESCETESVITITTRESNTGLELSEEETVEPEPAGHDWGEPAYSWTETREGYDVTGTVLCTSCGELLASETVAASYAVTQEPGCTQPGVGTWTASFTNEAFTTQTKTKEIPASGHAWGEPEWNWSDDLSTAAATFTCGNDASHVETATATVETSEGSGDDTGYTVYTATVTGPDGKEYTDVQKKIMTFTVTFDSNGGSAVEAQTVEYGKAAVRPDDPVRALYGFVTWNLGDAAYDFSAPVTADITLTAVWEEVKFSATVTMAENFNLNFYARNIDAKEAANYTVKWTFEGENFERNLTDDDVTIMTGGQYPGAYRIVLYRVFTYQMTKPFEIDIEYKGENIKHITYSLKQYFENRLAADNDGPELRKVYLAAIDYGASAQLYFDGKEYYDANGKLCVYDGDIGNLANSKYNPDNIIPDTNKPTNKGGKSGSIEGLTKPQAALIFGTETSIKFYFKYSGDVSGLSFSCNNGMDVTPVEQSSDGRYFVKINGLRSYVLYKDYVLTITKGREKLELTYSPYTYAANKWDSEDTKEATMVHAFVEYGNAAKAKWPDN